MQELQKGGVCTGMYLGGRAKEHVVIEVDKLLGQAGDAVEEALDRERVVCRPLGIPVCVRACVLVRMRACVRAYSLKMASCLTIVTFGCDAFSHSGICSNSRPSHTQTGTRTCARMDATAPVHSTAQRGTERHAKAQEGTAWHGMAWHGTA